jgi:hypothetical protein
VITSKTIQHAVVVFAAAAMLGSTVEAQTASAPAVRPDDPAKPQVQTMEMALGRALETAGRNFATRVTQIVPETMPVAAFAGDPSVSGIAVHDLSLYVFHVRVPDIGLQLQVMNMMVNRSQFGLGRAPDSTRVRMAGAVDPDPPDAPEAPLAPRVDLKAEYSVLVRDALVDAMLDNAGVLPMTGADTLLVVASGIDPVVSNPLAKMPSGKLVLKAKASDLAELRAGTITRDEARKRVQATKF